MTAETTGETKVRSFERITIRLAPVALGLGVLITLPGCDQSSPSGAATPVATAEPAAVTEPPAVTEPITAPGEKPSVAAAPRLVPPETATTNCGYVSSITSTLGFFVIF